ncbi:FAD-dependent monooxygenase [Streptomyces sp. NPDC001571]
MAHTRSTDVLIVGAGPVGLSAAAELARHGVRVRLVERLPARLLYAKAVGVQPRTLEIWDRMGLARRIMEAAVPLHGQLTYVNGVEQPRMELELPPEVPYGFAALPQYETERLLEEYLAGLGTAIERETELLSFSQDPDGVTALLRTAAGGEEEIRAGYLVGCDGAHSAVRKGLGLSFEGGAFPTSYMLADVEADWDLPAGYSVRASHRAADGTVDDLLVCVPLPGVHRYRLSMPAAPELLTDGPAEDGTAAGAAGAPADGIAHGLGGERLPELSQIQAVVDRLAPRPSVLSRMRWSSVFRISHRIVDRYGEGRVFVAGDAAHIHPPTGAQGMNTGIQDACNLAWKLALVLRGSAGPALLTSYDAERRPVGEEVVGRTVRHAAHGVQADPDDGRTLMLREAQLLIGYRDGPLATTPYGPADAPQPGDRAPDCDGLAAPLPAYRMRLLDVLRGCSGHAVILYLPDPTDPVAAQAAAELEGARALGAAAPGRAPGLRTVAVAGQGIEALEPGTPTARSPLPSPADVSAVVELPVPGYLDTAGEFARLYRPQGPTGFIVRPDGHLGARFPLHRTKEALAEYCAALSVPA